jgi:hypothetical protein
MEHPEPPKRPKSGGTTTPAILGLAAIVLTLLGVIFWCIGELDDWHFMKSSGGPEYVNYKIIFIVLPKPKPWFDWPK